jgi:GNAT superfamily N-acetyltransferase
VFIVDRIIRFYKKNGLTLLCRQAAVKLWQKVFIKPDVIYFADIAELSTPKCQLMDFCQIVERDAANPINAGEMDALADYIEPHMLRHQVEQRFQVGAKLWLLKKENACIGMVWTLVGRTVEPFYYLIDSQDVHFFNNEIFKPYRGKGFNPPLIEYVLFQMKNKGLVRAYIETNQRNIAEQRSLSKTSFCPVGKAIKLNLGKKNITVWSNSQ